MAIYWKQILFAAVAVLLLYSYPNSGQLDEDLLSYLQYYNLNTSDVRDGLLDSGVNSCQDVVRLKKEVAWSFIQNYPNSSDEIALFIRNMKDILEFEAWLSANGVVAQHCMPLLRSHSVVTKNDFFHAGAKEWHAILTEIEVDTPCASLAGLVQWELPKVFADKRFTRRPPPVTQATATVFSWVGGIFHLFWRIFLFFVVYVVVAISWFGLVLVVKKRTRGTVQQRTQDFFLASLLFIVPFAVCGGIMSFFRTLLQRLPRSSARSSPRFTSSQPTQRPPAQPSAPSFFSSAFFLGKYLDVHRCKIVWSGSGSEECLEYTVGSTISFEVQAFCRNGTPYAISSTDKVIVKLEVNQHTVPFSKSLPKERLPSVSDTGDNATDAKEETQVENKVAVTFFSRRAGQYLLQVTVDGYTLPQVVKIVSPGLPDAAHSSLRSARSCMAVTSNTYQHLTIQLCDIYGNTCLNVEKDKLKLDICQEGNEDSTANTTNQYCDYLVEGAATPGVFEILYNAHSPGSYIAQVLFDGQLVKDGKFSLISLTAGDYATVQANIKDKSLSKWYEAQLLKPGRTNSLLGIYIYLFPKHISIREYYVYFIPRKLHAFRIRHSTKMVCCPSDRSVSSLPSFIISDPRQGGIQLFCKDRDIVMATFAELLSQSRGGGESFAQKREFFYEGLAKLHSSSASSKAYLTIDRPNLIESSKTVMAQKGWKKKWEVSFAGERGLDYGGVSRELLHLLTASLFDPNTGMFQRLASDENTQGLVHPNPQHPANFTMSYYKFAGRVVGRCLLESSRHNLRLIKAHFTRSFLAQLIGLRVDHTYFETDDPELFATKIKYTLNNDVSDLEMVFAEEEYLPDNTVKIVPLVSGGENKPVTNDNKVLYLDLLAEYRLCRSVKEEVEAFLKGLNDIVPDNLLSIFDENELELLMCGVANINFEDLKKHSKLTSSQTWFTDKVMPWFWVVVSSYTQEELARLIQFTTGSSQLPPDGFAELRPKLQFSPAPVRGFLPTAHTCFNQLCLPDYNSCEDLQRALATAISEGSEGFQLL